MSGPYHFTDKDPRQIEVISGQDQLREDGLLGVRTRLEIFRCQDTSIL